MDKGRINNKLVTCVFGVLDEVSVSQDDKERLSCIKVDGLDVRGLCFLLATTYIYPS